MKNPPFDRLNRRRPLHRALVVSVGILVAACADDSRRPNGETCETSAQCESGLCEQGLCVSPGSLDQGAGICPGILHCLDGCTAKPTADAVSACSQACFAAADSELEGMLLADEINVCAFVENSCVEPTATDSDEVRRALFSCRREHCLGHYGQCYSGGTFGRGDCAGIATCLGACSPAGAPLCERACVAAATQAAADAWFDWTLCERSQCFSSTGAPPDDACATQAGSAEGACANAHAQCFPAP